MKDKDLSATMIEKILVIGLLLLVGVFVFTIYIMNGFLSEKVKEADHARIDAQISDTDIENMRRAGIKLEHEETTVERTQKIVAQSKLYQYQNEIINDLQAYASEARLVITGFTFSQNSADTTGTVAGSAPSTTPVAGTTTTTAQPKGVNSIQATITFGITDYRSMLKFIKLIEQNVTRMQITNLNLSPETKDANKIANPTMTIQVYTR